MAYNKADFTPFPQDAGRVMANLEAAYEQWLDARQQLIRLPVSMYWKTIGRVEYLGVKLTSIPPGPQGAHALLKPRQRTPSSMPRRMR